MIKAAKLSKFIMLNPVIVFFILFYLKTKFLTLVDGWSSSL